MSIFTSFRLGLLKILGRKAEKTPIPPFPTMEDAQTWLTKYSRWKYVLPLPNENMMYHVGAQTVENFYVVADAWAQVLSRYIQPNSHIMDIGCGCGRTARLLVINPYIQRYTGFDVIAPYIEWCNRYFGEINPGRFIFHHLDVKTDWYNPNGKLTGKTVTFPSLGGDVDLVFAASLFTHLLLDDAQHYMQESYRVLKHGGKALFSIHEQPQPGEVFSGTEFRADYELGYFVQLMSDEGLELVEDIGELCGQRTLLFAKQ